MIISKGWKKVSHLVLLLTIFFLVFKINAKRVTLPNASFEEWDVIDSIPVGWNLDENGLFPKGWRVEGRPGEKGYIRRIKNDRDSREERGTYCTYLNGKLIGESESSNLNGRTLQVSYWAKGKGGTVVTRIREYSKPGQTGPPPGFAILSTEKTDNDWRRYTAMVRVHPAYKCIQIELDAQNVFLDHMEIAELSTDVDEAAKTKIVNLPIMSNPDPNRPLKLEKWKKAVTLKNCLMNIHTGFLSTRQIAIRLATDPSYLYIAGTFGSSSKFWKTTCSKRDGSVWNDDSLEIHINPWPDKSPFPVVYQIILNTNGVIFDQAKKISIGQNEPGWNCKGIVVRREEKDGMVTVEACVPLKSVELVAGRTFGLNIAGTFQNPLEFTSLTGDKYTNYENMIQTCIVKESPAVEFDLAGDISKGEFSLYASIMNTSDKPDSFHVNLQLSSLNSLRMSEKFGLKPGETKRVELPDKVVLPWCRPSLKVINGTGKLCFDYMITYNRTSLNAPRIKRNAGIESKIGYYPVQEKISVQLPLSLGNKKDKSHNPYDKLEILVFSDGETTSKPIMQKTLDNFKVVGDKVYATMPFAPKRNGVYRIRVFAFGHHSELLVNLQETVEKVDLPWLGNTLGKDRIVIPPFTPMKVDGKAVSCRGREYYFGAVGFPERLVSEGNQVLTEPVELLLNGRPIVASDNAWSFLERSPDQIVFEVPGSGRDQDILHSADGKVHVSVKGKMEYDGLVHYSVSLFPAEDLAVIKSLTLRIPLAKVNYFHTSGNRRSPRYYIMKAPLKESREPAVPVWQLDSVDKKQGGVYYFPDGDGVVWSSAGIQSPGMTGDFLPFFWAGDHRAGLCWMADSDKGWTLSGDIPKFVLKRKRDKYVMDINIITKPVELKTSLTLSFGIITTPVKPRLTGTNVRYKVGVMAFPNMYQREAQQGFVCADIYLARQVYTNMKEKGLSSNIYVCGNLTSIGDPYLKKMYHEWVNSPPRFYEQTLESLPYKFFGPDKENYISVYTCAEPTRTDYVAYRMREWVNGANAGGLYLDNSYPYASFNIQHANGAYTLEDGSAQGVYHLFDKRELIKRCAVISSLNKSVQPQTAIHMTDTMIPGCFGFGDLYIDGEFAMPEGKDYIDAVPLARMEVFGASAWGGNQGWLPKIHDSELLKQEKPTRTMFALVKLFDMWLWRVLMNRNVHEKFRKLEADFGIDTENCKFIGYWDERAVEFGVFPKGVKASYYVIPGERILAYISNLNREEIDVVFKPDASRFGIDSYELIDAEKGKKISGKINIQGHDLRAVKLENIKNRP